MNAARPRIYVIGFNRCGTTSLHEFFTRAGYRSLHWDHGRLAATMADNAAAGRPVMAGYGDWEVFSDMFYHCVHRSIHANLLFRELAEQEPDALFILNVRDEDRWVRSLSYWHDRDEYQEPADHGMACDPPRCLWEPVRSERRQFGLDTVAEVHDLWRRRWREHIRAVTGHLPPERLLVFDIERDHPRALCRFAGLPDRMARNWHAENRSGYSELTRRAAACIPGALRRRLPAGLKGRVRRASLQVEGALWRFQDRRR